MWPRRKRLTPKAEIVHVDYAKPETVHAALNGVEAVFTATPYALLPEVEVDLVAAAKKAGVKTIVKLSGQGADSNPTSPHGAVEVAVKNSGLAYTFLRPNFFMQNYVESAAATIKDHGAFYEPADDGKSSYIDTRDIASVAVKALTEKAYNGKGYTLNGGEALSRSEVAAEISKVASKPVKYVNVDDAALRKAMAGTPQKLVDLMSVLMGYVRAGYTADTKSDLEAALGRKPITFAQFANDHASAWK